MTKTVRDIITGRAVVSVRPTDSVREAARAMYDQDVGAVLVMEDGRLRGIFTERDALRFFAATRRNPYIIDVGVVMTHDPVTVDADSPADLARDLMLTHGFRHLPVVEGGEVVGVVSLRGVSSDLP
ncbi:cyclic nucleotide-binding/CBS domain-containing protein [Magnetospirillum sp. SS-4]|uniref:CBS domain-containing protein n=1 Tax=Magnetospirillum sp. SS-4 TaxID=2681465 RepID=UPI00138409A6|nr:CBS domain-containing protein [Magnetospirillum sp. SS-4]CAA7627165.1 CBS protein [Magnetospirillum sp. SS-4]